MPEVIKPFTIVSIVEEPNGNQGVTVKAFKTEYTSETATRTGEITTFVSVPPDEDVDMFVFNFLDEGGWV